MAIRIIQAIRSWLWSRTDPYEFVLSEPEPSDIPAYDEGEKACIPPSLSFAAKLALCCSSGGLQFFWSTVMANLAPFLHRFGLSKTVVAITLVCQPLSGALLGPYIGVISDNLSTRWGRRRPMMVLGAAALGVSLIFLAWTDEVIRLLTCQPGSCRSYENAVEHLVQGMAIANTVTLSIAVQPLQSGIRSLIVDQTPLRQQSLVSACASFLVAVGSAAGFLAGSVPWPATTSILHRMTQFQALSLLTMAVVAFTVAITCFYTKELNRSELLRPVASKRRPSLFEILRTIRRTPQRVMWVCNVQFSAWVAWFCVLYYTTTYITELSTSGGIEKEIGEIDTQSVQVGTFASLYLALVALAITTAILLVLLYRENTRVGFTEKLTTSHLPALPSATLAKIWASSQALCGALMLMTLLPSSKSQGTVLIALLGIPWAITQWVPYAILGNEIAFLQQQAVEQGHDELQSGALLGIHNMAISAPQIVASVASGVIYTVAESTESRVPTGWIFGLGSFAAFGASRLACGLF